ncbi:alpha/beta fold hydrolase [Cellulomonas endophytica]|uniref:alpha/beta fold hydrolase n=1 Tax=Cellulomonas endophytica TaxID=2494735 RepID=UPI001010EB57|nr:alpha/beta hydrolase [Cellulomonas endophytica]
MTTAALPVVLVHGLRSSGTMWRVQREMLEGLGVPVAVPDLPGHGRRMGEAFRVVTAVEAVEDAVAGLGGRALVVGLSLGGYVALAHAARHPGSVAGVVAAACSTRPLRPLVAGWGLLARGIARLPDRGEALNRWAVERVLPPEAAHDAGAGGFALDVVGDALAEVGSLRPVEDLAALQVPVWIVNGRFDHFRGEERRFVRSTADARLRVVRRSTHLVSLVAPVAVNRVVLEALEELGGLPPVPGDAPARTARVLDAVGVPGGTG